MKPIVVISMILILTGCLKDDPLNIPFRGYIPAELNDGLMISTPQNEGLDPVMLASAYESIYTDPDLWSVRSMLVFRNSRLVSEAYMKNESDMTRNQIIWSCTKQVVSMLVGIALEQGIIGSVDDPISDYLGKEMADHNDKSSITLRHLLTMKSGIDFNNDGVGGDTDRILRQIPENITSYILSIPMKTDPGNEFFYKDGDPQLVTAILQSATGMPADEWADEVLFSRLGITNLNWVRYKDGTTLGGFGIETTPRGLGKIALCVSNMGRYLNDQVIPEWWITDMTTPYAISQDIFSSGLSFGYYWWIDPERDLYFMWGHGGQFAFVVPSRSLVIVMTSIPNTQGEYQVSAAEALRVVDKIIAACD